MLCQRVTVAGAFMAPSCSEPPTLWPHFREWCPCRCREAGLWLGFVLELPGEGSSCLRGPSAERCPQAPPG